MDTYRHILDEVVRSLYDAAAVQMLAVRFVDSSFDIRANVNDYDEGLLRFLESRMWLLGSLTEHFNDLATEERFMNWHDLRVYRDGKEIDYQSVAFGRVTHPDTGGFNGSVSAPWRIITPNSYVGGPPLGNTAPKSSAPVVMKEGMAPLRSALQLVLRTLYGHPAIQTVTARFVLKQFDIKVVVDSYTRDVELHLSHTLRLLSILTNRMNELLTGDAFLNWHDLKVYLNGEQVDYICAFFGRIDHPASGGYVGSDPAPWCLIPRPDHP